MKIYIYIFTEIINNLYNILCHTDIITLRYCHYVTIVNPFLLILAFAGALQQRWYRLC